MLRCQEMWYVVRERTTEGSTAWLAPCLLYFASGRVAIAHRQHP